MSLQFHWDNLNGYINYSINAKKILKLCLLQNYKMMSDMMNNCLLPSILENNMKVVLTHSEFIVVHIWNIDIEKVILQIKQREGESIGDFRDRVRPHIVNLVQMNAILLGNVKTYNKNMEEIKKNNLRPELEELLMIVF